MNSVPTSFRRVIMAMIVAMAALVPHIVRAQYSEDAMALREAQELYDERGFLQSSSISVDGSLVVSGSTGTVSYSYPISSQVRYGHPLEVSLNYCGAVATTAFRKYVAAHDANMTPYLGWERFSQNRPMWLLSVNGFVLNALSTVPHFINDSASRIFDRREFEFDDRDLVFLIDGYDYSNRMTDLNPDHASQEEYVDVIRLLRSDGSLLELVNRHLKMPGDTNPDSRPGLYTGYYYENTANPRGYGIVEYDSTYWPEYMRALVSSQPPNQRAALVPRRLRYYDGSGLEYIFREWNIPYGPEPLRMADHIGGGIWGGPTIFYLEGIRCANGQVATFQRSRHYPQIPGQGFGRTNDETRGRALVTAFEGHTISFGYNSMIVQALGRTTKIKFDVIHRSGTSTTEMMPYANLGCMTPMALEYAEAGEQDRRLHAGYVAYVSEIVDPEDRVTRFGYETVERVYEDFNFPMPNVSGTPQHVTLRNYRLTSVTEPMASYRIAYVPGVPGAINRTMTELAPQYQPTLNDVADSVDRLDPWGVKLTTTKYAINAQAKLASQTTIDRLTGQTRTVAQTFQTFTLDRIIPYAPYPRHTVLRLQSETMGDMTTATETGYGQGSGLPGVTGNYPYVIQPVWTTTRVNDILQSYRTYAYRVDTVRRFGGDGIMAARFGMEVTQQVAHTMRPDATSTLLFTDTTELLHLNLVDTTVVWQELAWNKLKSWHNYDSLVAIDDPFVRGRSYAELRYTPPVGHYEEVEHTDHLRLPPLYGLERATWRTAGDLVTGRRNHYETRALQGNVIAPRGKLLADTIIGDGGATLPGAVYQYRRGYMGVLPTGITNALGARQLVGYDHFVCDDDMTDCAYRPPEGAIVTSDDSVRRFTMTESSYALDLAKPVAERRIVRRYDPSGTLVRDTLATYNDITCYGLVSGTIDANGWYSRMEYDRNGRLRTAWLPYDFPRAGAPDTVSYSGTETMDLYGNTWHQRREDVLHCEGNNETGTPWNWTEEGSIEHTQLPDTLLASWPMISPPPCPCERSTNGSRRKDGNDRTLLATCEQDLPYPNYDATKRYYGVLEYRIDSASPLKYATVIDTLQLELMITGVDGECVHLEVAVDEDYTRTFIFECEGDGGGDDDPGEGQMPRKGSAGRSLLGGGLTRVAGGYRLVADLREIADKLQAKPFGGTVHIELRMKTPGGTVAFVSGGNAEDTRPKLRIAGEFRRPGQRDDYTLAFTYDDEHLTNTRTAKIDDRLHTMNELDIATTGGASRRTSSEHHFGADGRLLRSLREITEADGTSRVDTVRAEHDGLGQVRVSYDQEGNATRSTYDEAGRVREVMYADSARVRTNYRYGRPSEFDLAGQDFYGFVAATDMVDERGVVTTTYADALGQVRREVADASGLRLETRYEYDLLGRMTTAINPKGDVTRYTYDAFGRVATKSQPDLGTVSYAYDVLGNVRFTQSEKQAQGGLVEFNEYDDLNRLVYVGEAVLGGDYNEEYDDICLNCHLARVQGDAGAGEEQGAESTGGVEPAMVPMARKTAGTKQDDGRRLLGGAPRLTATLNPNVLNDGGASDILTAGRTLWMKPVLLVPDFSPDFWFRDCELAPNSLLGESDPVAARLIVHPTRFHPPQVIHPAREEDFEDIAAYPHFGRMAIAWDTMPPSAGAVWENFPDGDQWDRLAPRGRVRNQRGRKAAVAWRERGSEPYHYAVMSYDERGRLEALLRYTENLGFDAVYYGYNAMNKVTAVTTADYVRQHTTYYGYDGNGRADSVWTLLGQPTSGLYSGAGTRYPGILERPEDAGLFYHYDRRGLMDSLALVPVRAGVRYTYTKRGWPDTLAATYRVPGLGDQPLFLEKLAYDQRGQIMVQKYRHGTGAEEHQEYAYDPLRRLTGWRQGSDTTGYEYDEAGNRRQVSGNGTVKRDEYLLEPGGNRLAERVESDEDAEWGLTTQYRYNANGSTTERRWYEQIGAEIFDRGMDQYGYGHRELPVRLVRQRPAGAGLLPTLEQEWRYRYSAGGERDQKRLYYDRSLENVPMNEREYPWQYYLLGADKRQLAVYNGRQTSRSMCGDNGMRVMLYPSEYLTYGTGASPAIVTKADGSHEYHITDHLGSVRVVLDDAKTVVARKDYEPYGEVRAVTGEAARQGYIGKEMDRESDLAMHGVRAYSASEGRFLSIDPLLESLRSVTPYQYALNNPVQLVDASGEFPYTFFVRSFIPEWVWPSLCFPVLWGDNRGFSVGEGRGSRARINQTFFLDTDDPSRLWRDKLKTWSDPSHSFGRVRKAEPSDGFRGVKKRGNTFSWTMNYWGGHPFEGPSPDIDVFSSFTVTEDVQGGFLDVTAQITGDNYPATEAFVKDEKGTAVFIGVSAAPALGPLGPFPYLYSPTATNERITAQVRIMINSSGEFTGVQYRGKVITVGEWNRMHTSQKAVKGN